MFTIVTRSKCYALRLLSSTKSATASTISFNASFNLSESVSGPLFSASCAFKFSISICCLRQRFCQYSKLCSSYSPSNSSSVIPKKSAIMLKVFLRGKYPPLASPRSQFEITVGLTCIFAAKSFFWQPFSLSNRAKFEEKFAKLSFCTCIALSFC